MNPFKNILELIGFCRSVTLVHSSQLNFMPYHGTYDNGIWLIDKQIDRWVDKQKKDPKLFWDVP